MPEHSVSAVACGNVFCISCGNAFCISRGNVFCISRPLRFRHVQSCQVFFASDLCSTNLCWKAWIAPCWTMFDCMRGHSWTCSVCAPEEPVSYLWAGLRQVLGKTPRLAGCSPAIIANFSLVCENRDNFMSYAYMSSRLQTGQTRFGIRI